MIWLFFDYYFLILADFTSFVQFSDLKWPQFWHFKKSCEQTHYFFVLFVYFRICGIFDLFWPLKPQNWTQPDIGFFFSIFKILSILKSKFFLLPDLRWPPMTSKGTFFQTLVTSYDLKVYLVFKFQVKTLKSLRAEKVKLR